MCSTFENFAVQVFFMINSRIHLLSCWSTFLCVEIKFLVLYFWLVWKVYPKDVIRNSVQCWYWSILTLNESVVVLQILEWEISFYLILNFAFEVLWKSNKAVFVQWCIGVLLGDIWNAGICWLCLEVFLLQRKVKRCFLGE